MKIIPVIDLKDGVVVHAQQGHRQNYQPVNTPLCKVSDVFQVIEAFLGIYAFDTFYIADLNAITNQGNNIHLLNNVLTHYPQINFWLDRGYQKYHQLTSGNVLPVLGSESYQNEFVSEIQAYQNNFILSLDYLKSAALGASSLFSNPNFWPKNIIIMTLDRVGSNSGPDFVKLSEYCQQYPDKNFIAAGGIRHNQDLLSLSEVGIRQALVASALHSGALKAEDISKIQAKKYPN